MMFDKFTNKELYATWKIAGDADKAFLVKQFLRRGLAIPAPLIGGDIDYFVTGMGQFMLVHGHNDDCFERGCVCHNPSQHELIDCPTFWDWSERSMKRLLPNGFMRQDPDEATFLARNPKVGTATPRTRTYTGN